MHDFSTPMMKQYLAIKEQYQDCLLLYRMGDFYELFLDDAHTGARVLNITLTSRAKGKDGRIPMAGVPYHALDNYLPKLIKAGYKVAICEQVSLPNKKGIIEREVVRIVTPGTVMDEKALRKKENNYIVSLLCSQKSISLAIADISTGYFCVTEIESNQLNKKQLLADEFAKINPKECILPEELYNDPEFLSILHNEKGLNVFPFPAWHTYADDASRYLKNHFGVATLAGFGIDSQKQTIQAAAALLGYLEQTQKGRITHIKRIISLPTDDYVMLDRSTILNLELFSTIREHDTKGTLLSVLDETVTSMGGRLLKQWLRKPLTDKALIEKRYNAVEHFIKNQKQRNFLRESLEKVTDIERLLSRLSVGLGNARDLINLKESLKEVLEIKRLIADSPSELVREVGERIRTAGSKKNKDHVQHATSHLPQIIALIESTIAQEPPISVREGGLIREGVNKELDKLRTIVGGSKEWIVALEKKEREKTGISSLKIRFNQVFGFYIEVSKANLVHVPQNYMRKQTLVNAERFITPELKDQEEIILTAEERINEIEYTMFVDVLEQVLNQTTIIQEAADCIAVLDCLITFAHLAEKRNYIRPKLLYSGEITITNGRHPVVETLLENKQFVPNDVTLDAISQQLLVITGPNMAGKSVFIRQVAAIVLMAQMGCFVPAEKAEISPVDRIFVRSGASDVITSGLSTFMVEMVETANILHHATKDSLIIMDEIGRGTSTYDGISIAWAVAEYLATKGKGAPKTLFATHYHELQTLEEQYPKIIKNYHMSVADNHEEEPIFLYTLTEGGASHSFGIAVAKLAGIPEPIIKRAKELLKELESRHLEEPAPVGTQDFVPLQYSTLQQTNLVEHMLYKELEEINIHQLTPLEALNKLAELKDSVTLLEKQNKEQLLG